MNSKSRREGIAQLEASIDLPPTSYFVKGEQFIRFAYRINRAFNYLVLATQVEVAEFLQNFGYIKTYMLAGSIVKMFQKTIITTVGQKGEPVQSERLVEKQWADIAFTQSEIIHFAAVNEYDKAMKAEAPIVRMFSPLKRIA